MPHWMSVIAIAFATADVSQAPGRPVTSPALADRLGCAHANGAYSFTRGDYLNEGADCILKTGMRVIKVYLHNPAGMYRFNSEWPKFGSLVEMARHPHYRKLFGKPFTTFVLTTFAVAPGSDGRWRDGFTDEQYADEKRQFYELAKYLLETYRGVSKTFVLQNWEGDWALRNGTRTDPESDPEPPVIANMIRWMDARQEGVEQARREVRASRAKVYHACEVNLVALAMQGRPTVTNDVLPKTRCDLYSYSAYDTIGVAADDPIKGRELFRKALEYLAAKAPDSPAFGAKNVYVGEFGWPEVRSDQDPHASTEKSLQVIRMTVEVAADWGCPYIIYWQVYDNESRAKSRRPTNADVRGFYLIRPDGTPAAARDYFMSLLRPARGAR